VLTLGKGRLMSCFIFKINYNLCVKGKLQSGKVGKTSYNHIPTELCELSLLFAQENIIVCMSFGKLLVKFIWGK
jgi:hypothetical protein